MDKTNIKVEFSIYGDEVDPSNITKRLNIVPTLTYMKGDSIPYKKITRKETSWGIETGYEEALDINDILKKIVIVIIDKVSALKQIKQDYNANILFMIVVNIKNNEPPAMYFTREFIEFAGAIGAEIGFDTYIY